MLSSVTIDDSDGNAVVLHAETGKRALVSATGLYGIGPIRESMRDRPTAHGSINDARFESGRLIVLDGEVFSDEGIEDAFTEFRAITKPMLQTLDAPATLKWTEGETGLALQREVKLFADVDPPISDNTASLSYQAQLFAEDPRAYSQTLQTVEGDALSEASGGLTFASSTPGANLVTNGTFESGVAGWENYLGGSIVQSADAAHSGSFGGRITMSGLDGARYAITTPVAAGDTYIVSLYIRRASGAATNVPCLLDNGTHASGFELVPTPTFERVSFTLTSEVAASSLLLTIWNQNFLATVVDVDDVEVRKASVSTGGLTFPFQFTPSGGGTAECTNAGNRPTPATFKIYGEATNPQILLEGSGERIVLNGTVNAGDYLEVDVANRQVILNGEAERNNFVVSASTTWFEIPPGTHNVRMIAETFDEDAHCDVLYRSAYA